MVLENADVVMSGDSWMVAAVVYGEGPVCASGCRVASADGANIIDFDIWSVVLVSADASFFPVGGRVA